MAADLNDIQRAASEQFGRQSHRYARGHILENVEDVQAALGRITVPTRARVLDVATGAGHTGLFLASLGHEVTLCDLTEAMLERARESAAARGLSVQLRQHSAEAMPYAGGSFDLVTCRVAPHHFSSPGQFVAEVARVLAPGGWFLLIDGSVPDDEPEAEAWLHEVEKLRDPSHHRFLTPRAWAALCHAASLTVRVSELHPRKQPDLNWYFGTAATPPENRRQVLDLVARAPAAVRRVLALGEEDGKIVWWWPMLTLIARKGGPGSTGCSPAFPSGRSENH
ncbi:MAG: methyltransferase domain-containing protein [Verrucomicrobia bacterium]|nr:methyltransferase domain-containing protein [Verrucomicrobiota bacterium]